MPLTNLEQAELLATVRLTGKKTEEIYSLVRMILYAVIVGYVLLASEWIIIAFK